MIERCRQPCFGAFSHRVPEDDVRSQKVVAQHAGALGFGAVGSLSRARKSNSTICSTPLVSSVCRSVVRIDMLSGKMARSGVRWRAATRRCFL
jgi:hypothetical protein